ncbi:hypothetical protein [Sphingomonas sp.]|uniref:hypothetical protein n=1 Tax=Sphingomonas sp. TaxID=28214 RepID=UPI003AFF9117
MKRLLLGAPLLLGACGSAVGLKPPPGVALPVAPYGATTQPTPIQLVTPTPQQRPQRSDELLRNSEERRADDFDLPPDDGNGN